MTRQQTGYERAVLEYDPVHERILLEAIARAIFEASLIRDCNAAVVRTGDAARALTKSLAIILAMSPSASKSSTAIRRATDEFEKLLCRYVAEAERDGDVQDFILRNSMGPEVGGSA